MNFRHGVVFTFLIHALVVLIDKGGGLVLYLLTAEQPDQHGGAGIVASLPFVLGAVANLGLATALVWFVRRKRFTAQECFETSLAVALGSRVRVDRRLTEGTGFVGALQVLGEAPDNSVLCSHGDVIPDTMQALQRRGCHIIDEPNWGKGSVWLIHRDAHGDFTEASVWPPPEV